MDSVNNYTSDLLGFINVRNLPFLLQELVDLIGCHGAYQLTYHYGGQMKYIAKSPDRSAIRSILPGDKLRLLCARYGGETLEIPKVDHFCKQIRNLLIIRELARGKSRAQVAREFNLGVRQVGNIKKEYQQYEYCHLPDLYHYSDDSVVL